jgi:hypothetical protein
MATEEKTRAQDGIDSPLPPAIDPSMTMAIHGGSAVWSMEHLCVDSESLMTSITRGIITINFPKNNRPIPSEHPHYFSMSS